MLCNRAALESRSHFALLLPDACAEEKKQKGGGGGEGKASPKKKGTPSKSPKKEAKKGGSAKAAGVSPYFSVRLCALSLRLMLFCRFVVCSRPRMAGSARNPGSRSLMEACVCSKKRKKGDSDDDIEEVDACTSRLHARLACFQLLNRNR